jgi:hypothetical protein
LRELQERSLESVRHEYEEAGENIRHYSNLRFAVFSVFSVVIGALIAITFSGEPLIANGQMIAKAGGLLITWVFWNFEERVSDYVLHFQRIAGELEHTLGYRQLTEKPRAKFPVLSTIYTVRIFFTLLTCFWIYVIAASLFA